MEEQQQPLQSTEIPVAQEQQMTEDSQPTAPKSHIMLILGLGAVVFLGLGLAGGYFLWGIRAHVRDDIAQVPNQPSLAKDVIQKETKQALSPTEAAKNQPVTTIPVDWTYRLSNVCNVSIPVPPKKEPYTISQNSPTAAENDKGRSWVYQEAENTGSTLFTFQSSVSLTREDGLGSGYVPGHVSVLCGNNTNKYTTEMLVQEYEKQTNQKIAEDIIISVERKGEQTKWGRKVTVVTVKGGMYDESEPFYFFATEKKVYMISKVAMSQNSMIKQTTQTIFDNLQFRD